MTPTGSIVPGLGWAELLYTEHHEFVSEQLNPSQLVRRNLVRHAQTLWAPARVITGPLHVTSGYRCFGLNELVKGSTTSVHMIGCATDNVPMHMGVFDAMCALVTADLPFDQLIYEFGVWLHFGSPRTSSATPRKQFLMRWPDTKARTGHDYEIWRPDDPRVQRVARKRRASLNGAAHPRVA